MNQANISISARIRQGLGYSLIGILCLMPFHAFLTTWLGSSVGHYRLIQVWKEILLLIIVVAVILIYRRQSAQLLKDKLVWLIIIYTAFTIFAGLLAYTLEHTSLKALAFALIINLRFLVFFLCIYLGASIFQSLKKLWPRILLIPASLVILFGLLQVFVLPHPFLEHFGYSPQTILPFRYVNEDPQFLRVQSTLRGANALGVYLLLIITAATALAVRAKQQKYKPVLFALSLLGLLVLFFTYSRSAWIGTLISLVALAWWLTDLRYNSRKFKIVASASGLLLLGGGIVIAITLNNSQFVQNTLLHTDRTSTSPDTSNEVRAESITKALSEVIEKPLGSGPGTAGPASVQNSNQSPRIAENYYLQIAQEVGVVGLAIFLAINFMVAFRLWQRRNQTLAAVLLASFLGLVFVNMVSHAWTDDTIAYLWWGLAAIALAAHKSAKNPAPASKNT